MIVEMHKPHSYTGEDVVELHLHGAPTVVRAIVERCLSAGARMAQPGEFTLRAFLAGRLDLAQAEAVQELIAAHNESQRKIAVGHLRGDLSRKTDDMIEALEAVLATWQAALDFSEQVEDVDAKPEHFDLLNKKRCNIQSMLDRARADWSRPLRLVLCGAPNTGKSTLLNRLAGEERVLVDHEPGTTRDPVEVEMKSSFLRWTVWDTAGMRTDATGIEARGIEMSKQRVADADVALWLIGAKEIVWPDAELTTDVLGSKCDLLNVAARTRVQEEAQERGLRFWGWVSGKTGQGVEELEQRIVAHWLQDDRPDDVVVVRARHVEALRRAAEALDRVLQGRDAQTLDVLTMDLEEATAALGHIVGRNIDVEVLDRIFAQFCLGK